MVTEREALVKKLVVSTQVHTFIIYPISNRIYLDLDQSVQIHIITGLIFTLLQDDKKFYQLELVNRETGFGKVFNASANVGVINPLIKVSTHLTTARTFSTSTQQQRKSPKVLLQLWLVLHMLLELTTLIL